ncbi:SusC/RagA family TonB-linked outer membrane protein [Pedobacter namyangjuensis]|uniref:SusC/RagA family TonB-linked outer membrane protein n=1 Tax=Pedobacter namyangjuensis TaxID=600626 RepID=UPI000DE2C2A9|nr:TonB-dependent receptor [Pedobacter namyangjuensis]
MNRKSILILLGFLLFATATYAQKTIRGKVTDVADGVGIPGVSVLVKGTAVGTTTQPDGTYTLNLPTGSTTLVFKYLGYETKEAVIGAGDVNVSLSSSQQNLDEVLVVAYGTTKKSTYTGSAASIKPNKDLPLTSFENALAGRTPGVQVTQSSGQAGATASIRIRGIGSMSASNEPLYVIDGVPVVSGNAGQMSDYTMATNNIMSSLNPADIETVTILKDAAASSLYGSRAANGVVIITTKKGKSGKPSITVRSSVGFTPTWATDNYETAGPQEQINMLYSILYDSRIAAGRTPQQANEQTLMRLNSRNWAPGTTYGTPTTGYGFGIHGYEFSTQGTSMYENVTIKGKTDGVENRDGKFYDWENALFRTAIYQTNDVAVSGGDENTKYYTSFAYTKDQSRVRVNDFDRFSGRLNLSQNIGKYVELATNINLARTSQSGYNDTRNTGSNYFLQTRNLLWGFYWPTDYKTGLPFTARYNSLAQNAIYYDNEWENSSVTKRITANETVTVKILPELNLKSIFSYDNSQITDDLYYSALHFNGVATKGSVNAFTTNVNKLVSSTTLNFNKSFEKHNLGLLAGFEAEKNKTEFQRSTGTDLPSSALHTVATAGVTNASAYDWGNSIVSFLSRAEYDYNQQYFLSGSFRRDGSSRLDPRVRWGNFWSIAGAWKINGEEFMKDLTYISNLRLRASYGTNGTTPTANFGWRSLTGYGSKYLSQPGGTLTQIADPNLTWETSYSTNFALEFGLFNNRITGSVEYFNKDSRDLLQDVPTSMITGFSSTLRNVGEMNNRGIEVDLGGDIISKNGWRWSANVNATFIKSKVAKLNGGKDIIWTDPTGGDARAQYIFKEGQPTYSFYGFEWAGTNPADGKNVWYKNGATATTTDFVYNGRPATSTFGNAAQIILGDASPKVYGGFNTDVEYKGISLALNFIYKIGGKIYDGASKDVADDGYYWERIRSQEYYDNMWTPGNPNGTLPKLSGLDLTDAIQYSSRNLYDASFMRLKNVTVAYRLPTNIISKIGASNARVYFNGSNLLTFSKFKNADPEVNSYGTRGWETPFGKTYTFGLEFGF